MYDFVIIGSGVSGGRIAFELTQGGAKCLLLEAGNEFNAKTFPNNELDYSTQMFWGGGLEITADGTIGLLRAKCLGGTSVVNQALLDRFDDLAWQDWRERSGIEFFTGHDFTPHYDACEKSLSVSSVPVAHYNANTHIFTKAFNRLSYGWKPLRRAQGDCKLDQGSDCIVCLGGCPRNSKQSSLITTLAWARQKGLQIECDFEVHHLAYEKEQVRIFGTKSGLQTEISCGKVVLAAGALGNSAILLRSGLKSNLPALGMGFTCHPQYMTYALYDHLIDAHKGAFQAVKSDDLRLRKAGYKFENVFAPPIGTAMLMPGMGRDHMRLMSQYRHMASMEVALRDEPSGRIVIESNDKLRIEKKLTPSDRSKAKEGLKLVRELFRAAGAKEIIQCPQTFGLHLMGGCPMGTNAKTSVITPEFRVHGYPRLFAADSSVFPTAPGINPSFTIMALSHRASREMLK